MSGNHSLVLFALELRALAWGALIAVLHSWGEQHALPQAPRCGHLTGCLGSSVAMPCKVSQLIS